MRSQSELLKIKEASDIADKINTFNTNKQGLKDFSQTTLDSNFSGTTISSDDILRLDENIAKFQATLQSLEVSNPQRAKYLNELLEEYKQAKDVFLGAQATNRIVSSKDFKLENIGSFIGVKIAKNKAMNVDSQEWLQSVLNDYSKSVTSTTAQKTEQVQEAPKTAEKDNTKTKPKSQEQINQEKIQALEEERRQKLSEVQDLTISVEEEVISQSMSQSEIEAKKTEINREIKKLENKISALNSKINTLNTPQDTDPLVDEFAKENNDDVLDYKKVNFQGKDVVVYTTNQPDDWSGKGSSFKQTWNVLKFNQSFPNMTSPAHVRILMTNEQKEQYNPKEKSGFSKELRDLAKTNRDSDNVVLIDIRPVRYNQSDIKKQQDFLQERIKSAEKSINNLKESLTETNTAPQISKQTTTKTTKPGYWVSGTRSLLVSGMSAGRFLG